jgi:hypothetical protein
VDLPARVADEERAHDAGDGAEAPMSGISLCGNLATWVARAANPDRK